MATRSVPQPPFSVDILADLHAGNLEPEVREQLWPAVHRDPDALRVLRSLDEVSTGIRALGAEERVLHPMPVDIAARLERFVTDLGGVEPTEQLGHRPGPADTPPTGATEPAARLGAPAPDSAGPARNTVVPLARRRRRTSLLAAAAAALLVLSVAAGITAILRTGTETGTPTAQPPSALDVGDQLTSAAALGVMGRNDVTGPLGSAAALQRCVAANGLERPVLGSTDVVFRGGPAVLVLLAGPRSPGVTALVVGTGCTTGDPQQLTRTDIG